MQVDCQSSEEEHSFNDLISGMERLLDKSRNVKSLRELEAIEAKANKIVMRMVKEMEKSRCKPEDVEEVLSLHKLIIFRNGYNWRNLFSNH